MVKARLNSVLFQLLWSCAPVLVSITSFLVFVLQGNELTVSIAFTVRLFLCLYQFQKLIECARRLPYSTWSDFLSISSPRGLSKFCRQEIFRIYVSTKHLAFQTKVALDRIATYLDEDEVDEQVSSLKRSHFGTSAGDDDTTKGLGIENGTFKWNEVEEKDDDATKTKSVASTSTDDVVQGAYDETERGSITASDVSNHRFELRDVNIMFPERQLTVVTGPTASGKTALLVSFREPLLKGRAVFIWTLLDGFAR